MIESQSLTTHSQVQFGAGAELVAQLALEAGHFAVVVEVVVRRVGALGAHADHVLCEGAAGGQRQCRGAQDQLVHDDSLLSEAFVF